jgi:hypothetical protein
MGGIGIELHSQEGKGSPSTALTSLPDKVVSEIATKLGIVSAETRQALTAGKMNLPDDVEVKITRLSNSDSCTIKKLAGGSTYRITYRNTTVDITP